MFNISKIFVTLFYLGYSKIIPGTIGSFFSFIIIYFLNAVFIKIYLYFIFTVLFFLSLYFIKVYQRTICKIDPSEVVIDEFLGIFIIFFLLIWLPILFRFYKQNKRKIKLLVYQKHRFLLKFQYKKTEHLIP